MKSLQDEYGISPAVGVILLLGITAALATVAGIVLLDIGDGLSQNAQAGVEVNETTEGVEVTWTTDSNADEIIVQANGQRYTLNSVNDSLTLGLNEGSNVSVIGVIDGEESVISETTTESDTGDNTVENYNPGSTETLSGTVSVNPPIDGATVRVVKNDTVIATTTTDSSGNYSVEAPKKSQVEVVVENFQDTELSNPFYASTIRNVGTDLSSDFNIEFDESNIQNVTVNGSTVSVINESYNGSKTIGTVEQLQAINNDLSGDYTLIDDIDASATSSWNSGSGFEPIGEFTGMFNGDGYTISGLSIDRSSGGLFGDVSGATIEDVQLVNIDITSEGSVGGLAGNVEDSTITNIEATGSIEMVISGFGAEGFGGVIGSADNIEGSEYTSNVTITGSGDADVASVGGVIGLAADSGTLENLSSQGSITIDANENDIETVGGVIGEADATSVQNATSTGDISLTVSGISSVSEAGGLIGVADGSVQSSYSEGNTISGGEDTGGLIGTFDGTTLSGSYSDNTVTGTDTVGGLVGRSDGSTIQNSFSSSSVTSDDVAGGLVGDSDTDIEGSYATGDVTVDAGETGGLVGASGASISESYATGDVTVTETTNTTFVAGGLVGQSTGSVTDSYANNLVDGRSNLADSNFYGYSGGFVGENRGTIQNSYTVGDTTGVDPSNTAVQESAYDTGGFVADNEGSVTDSYWDSDSSSQTDAVGQSDGGSNTITGLTTSNMQGSAAESNMSALDFTDVWTTNSGGYPTLQD